jgi:hypothetical protein
MLSGGLKVLVVRHGKKYDATKLRDEASPFRLRPECWPLRDGC